MIKITEKPLKIQKILDTASSLEGGALNMYIGKVQTEINGKKVLWLEYETNEGNAIKQIRSIIEEASKKFDIKGYAFAHRIGTLKPSEVAIGIAVSTPHSETSLNACQYILNEMKTRLSIWQKECFQDGTEWVSPKVSMNV